MFTRVTNANPRQGARTGSDPRTAEQLRQSLVRYRTRDRRSEVFRDLVLRDVKKFPPGSATVLDIGCGRGFDGDAVAQRAIASRTSQFIGIEPDTKTVCQSVFSTLHRCTFEEAPVDRNSIHVAYSLFVLEHIETPWLFWEKLYDCLVPGGVFWGFTVDARHPFAFASTLLAVLRVKDVYLNWLHGERGADRYENFPTFYRANTRRQIHHCTSCFSQEDFLSLHRVGQLDNYFPRWARHLVHLAERMTIALHLPGSILALRLMK